MARTITACLKKMEDIYKSIGNRKNYKFIRDEDYHKDKTEVYYVRTDEKEFGWLTWDGNNLARFLEKNGILEKKLKTLSIISPYAIISLKSENSLLQNGEIFFRAYMLAQVRS
ncbi:MAG: hypothetical protein NT120_04210 [Candidatus Aenigmarchaeota archaeon]|nr:hypothetical protein [Candidatus Aenigmarchaeota archaeon]